ncbi:S-methyl-5'-thioadenosine phosphorylase [Euryhalocaulis caribicus]|uniref:S-methyl-5'-thioadenosine phosphorylase n=1 Tax=Euryhalocaulis caribicus TaxID=1161401 RepID=UPI0003A53006|nr:S-methyl-5'-thioadenosine phosphorylase [Euryhalocaulis caribicus]
MSAWTLGVIGGSGLYEIDGLENVREERIETPWGDPSDALIRGEIGGVSLVFLPRHGRGHPLPPSGVNYRANIDALKRAGVTDILSISACGSLKEELPPGAFLLVDQFVDRTINREKSFFGPGCVGHVSVSDPVCARLSGFAAAAARKAGADVTEGGTYLAMEGPQFSTRAESRLHKSWGCSVVGMTNMPEAKLAREAELPYASLCMVTDYDCWRDGDDLDVSEILAILKANADKAKSTIRHLAESLPETREASPQGIERALDFAILTAAEARDPALVAKLDAVAGRVLG